MIKNFSRDEIIQMLKSYPEQPKFDWKRDLNISSTHKKSEIVKDVIAIANAHGTSDGYILYGVDPKEHDPIIGITISLDDASIQQIVSSKIDRLIDFQYFEPEIDGKKIGIIKIIKNQKRPFIVKVDYGVLKKDTILIRRGSSTDFANYDDLQKMYFDPNRIEFIHTRVTALCETIHKDAAISFIINEYLEIMKMREEKDEIEWSTLEITGIPIKNDKKNFEYRIINGYISHINIVDPGFANFEQIRQVNSEKFIEFRIFIAQPILVLEQYLKGRDKILYMKMTLPREDLKEQIPGFQENGFTYFFYFSSDEITRILVSLKQRILNRLINL